MDIIVCSVCGGNMSRFEYINGAEVDWANDVPICPVCRGVNSAPIFQRSRDVLGGFAWKRDAEGKKMPK